jgi:2,4-dienoyl-CoA reductase-like NADH-dependent reductase (Old Yellow Enzyme family)
MTPLARTALPQAMTHAEMKQVVADFTRVAEQAVEVRERGGSCLDPGGGET